MKRALILSGGGAKGAFQLGALRYIMERQAGGLPPSRYFDIISGVSVGALNGVMMAQNRFEALEGLWQTISSKDVYNGDLDIPSAFWRIVSHKLGLLDNAPLWRIIRNNVALEMVIRSGCDFIFGSVSMDTGLYYSFHATDFDDETQFLKGILASAAMPVLLPPVDRLTDRRGVSFHHMADGGIRNTSPLGRVIDLDPDELVIINCNARDCRLNPERSGNMLKVAVRILTEITVNEIFRQDLREFVHINEWLEQLPGGTVLRKKDGRPLKRFKSVFIEPDHDLGDSLDFSRRRINAHIGEGYEAALAAYENYPGRP